MARKRDLKHREVDALEQAYEHHETDESRTVYLVGDIDEAMVRTVVERITVLSEKDAKTPIVLIINTLGGDVDDAFMLYDLMKLIPTPIHTVGLGKVMSAGCLLLAAGTKGKRRMGANARLMYHGGWSLSFGNVFEMRAELEAFEAQETQYDRCFAVETGMSLADVEMLYDKSGPSRNHYITAQRACELGVVDEVI